jgi:hypothetical protein
MGPEQDPADSAFDAALNSMRQSKDAEENGRATSLFNASKDIPIEKAAKILDLMGKTGIDVDILNTNLEEAEQLAPDTNWEDFRKTSPIMARWYSQSQYHMKVGEEDRKSGAAQNLERMYYRKDDTVRPLTKDEVKARGDRYGKRHAAAAFARRQLADSQLDPLARAAQPWGHIQTQEQMEKALSEYHQQELGEENEFVAKTDKVGFLETWQRRGKDNPAFLFPFVGEGVDAFKNAELMAAATAKNPSEDQQDLLERYGRLAEAAERRGTDVVGKTAEILTALPATAGEFALTGGAYRLTKAATMNLLRQSTKRAITRGVGTVAGAAAQTLADPIANVRDTIKNMTPGIKITATQEGELGYVLDPKVADDFIPAINKAFGSNFVEKFSERTGAGLDDSIGWLKKRMFKEAFEHAPAMGVQGFLSKVGKATGWNGVLGEMFEERVGEVMKAGLGIEEYKAPSFEQLVAEFMAFSVPGTPGQVAQRIKALKNHGDAEARVEAFKELAAAIKENDVVQRNPEVGQRLIETLSEQATKGTDKELGYLDPHEFAESPRAMEIGPEAAAVELMGTAETYKQAVINGHDMQVPRSRIDSVLLMGESATYFQDKIRDKAGQQTVKETKAELDRIDAIEKEQKEQAEAVKQAKQEQAESAEAVKQIKDSVQKVADQIIQGMEAAGRKAEARQVSKIVAHTFRILGQKQRADPHKLFQKKPLTINVPLKQEEMRDASGAMVPVPTLGQPAEASQPDDSRGYIEVGNARLNIQLPKTADRSTFLHEFGHFYVEVLADLAAQEDATEEIQEHFGELLKWWGIKDVATWRSMTHEQKRKYHEKFAKTWEKYLEEGNAPSKGLRKVFHQITKWLTSVYKDSPTYFDDIQISPEIRRFMDRMLATEEEIEEAQADYGRPLYETFVKAGMDPDRAAKLAKATEENAEAVSSRLRARAMKDIQREESAAWKEEKEEIRPEIAKQVDAQPVYKLLHLLKTGKLPESGEPQAIEFPEGFRFKLDKAAVKELYANPVWGYQNDIPDTIPSFVYAASGDTMHPDVAASLFPDGTFKDGRALLDAIANAEPREQLIDRLAEEKMIERHGPPMTKEQIAAEAEKALHGKDRDKVLRLELEELAAKNISELKIGIKGIMAKARVPNPDEVRRRAEKDIAAHPVGWINPAIYRSAEIKAEKKAEEFALKGNWKEAYDQKVISYINHARYVAAMEARDNVRQEIVNARDLKKSDKKFAKSSDVDLINAARSVYAAFGIGKFDKQASKYLAQLEKYDPEVYKSVKAEIDAITANAQDYREIKYSEFLAMQEAVAGLLELAKGTKQTMVEGKKVDIEDAKAELLPDVKKHSADYATEGGTRKPGMWADIKRAWLSVKALGRRAESWADAMGPSFTKYIWSPVKDGILKYRSESVRVRRAYLDMLKENAQIFDNKPIHSTDLNYTFENKAELLGALLHSGNESNLMKLLVGGRPGNKWGETDEKGNLDTSKWNRFRKWAIENGHITKADYDFCQAVWDLNDSIKGDAQKAFKYRYGRFFKDIEADYIQTPWGPYRGGYVPAKVDPRLVQDGAIRLSKQEEETFNNTYSHPSTYEGFTKARSAGYAKPLNLDLRQITKHFDEVLRFAHISPRTSDVMKLLQEPEINAALAAHDPEAFKEMLIPWLQRSLEQKSETAGFNKTLDRVMRAARKNAGMQLMVGNLTNALQNYTGISVAGVKVKKQHLRNALFDYMKHPKEVAKEISEESEYMNQLLDKDAASILRDIDEIIQQPNGFTKFRDYVEKHSRALQELTQNPVSIMSYMAAKNQALENGMSEKDAIREAEATVRLTQGAVGAEDIARFEAGTPFTKMFTQFIGYWSMKANLMGTEFYRVHKELGLKEGAGRAFDIYVMGHMIPAALGAIILKTMGKGWDDDDDDGYLDEVMAMFFGAQFREALAYVPIVGQGANAAMNAFGSDGYGDRFLNAPAVSLIEAGLKVPGRLYKAAESGELKKGTVKDFLSVLGLMSGVPTGALGRPVGYLMDVESGRAEPSGPFDFARGVITGKAGKK